MQKVVSLIKTNIYLFILLFISSVSHWYVFFDNKILNAGDWLYVPLNTLKELGFQKAWMTHVDLGVVSVVPSNFPFFALASFFSTISSVFSWDIFTRIFFLVPIIFLVPFFSFLLFKKIFKNDLIAFFSACIYSFNTFFLKLQLDWITYAFIWWIFPALFLSILKYLETKKNKYLVYNSLLVFIGIVYEIRIMILVLISLSLFQIVHLIIGSNKFKKKIKDNVYIFISYGIGVLMHAFWLIPIKMGLADDVMTNASPEPFASYYDILDVLTLHMYSWSHNLVLESFIKQPIELRHFLIPLFAIIGIIVCKKLFKDRAQNVCFVFFGISLLIFAFWSKQEFIPFGEIYRWAFFNVPLFNIYRESSKFFILVAMSLSFFYGIGLYWIYNFIKKYNKKIALSIIAIILFFSSIFNLQHFFDQKIGGMAKGVEIPNDYNILEKNLSNDNEYYRILWLPIKHRFSFYSEAHPFLRMTNLINILDDRLDFILFDENFPIQDQLLFLLEQPYSNQLLDKLSVKYIIVPTSNKVEIKKSIDSSEWVYEIFRHYGDIENPEIRNWYISELDEIDYLEKIDIGTEELAIYENKNYKPHITALDNIYSLTSLKNLDTKYNFIDKQLDSSFDFVLTDNNENIPVTNAYDIFENISPLNLKNNKISIELQDNNKYNSTYINIGKENIYYNVKNGLLTIYSRLDSNLYLSEQEIYPVVKSNIKILYSNNLQPDRQYYIQVGSQLLPVLKETNKEQNLGIITKPIKLFSAENINLIPNPSFENGLWSEKVGDCNHYDENGILDMRLSQEEKTDGDHSLQLEAARHIACTGPGHIKIKDNADYLFSFDYQSPKAKMASYNISFNDSDKTTTGEKLGIQDNQWLTFGKYIRTPLNATTMSLSISSHSQEDGKTNIITRYDNFRLLELEFEDNVDMKYQPKFTELGANSTDKFQFEYIGPWYDFANLINNGSLEKGLWSEKVGDCNHYDNKGILDIRLSQEEKTDGNNSLQLEATRHIACTGPGFTKIKEGVDYLFSFDYQSSSAKQAGYSLNFNNSEKDVVSEKLPVEDNTWNNFAKIIKGPEDTTAMSLTIFAYATDKKTNNIVRYDNFQLIELPDLEDRYYFVGNPQLNLKKPKSMEFELVNPTKKIVHIKGATTPFFLAISEAYHPQWQLHFNNEKVNGFLNKWIPFVKPDKVSDDHHFELSGFLNGWYVDPVELCDGLDSRLRGNDNSACTLNPDGSYDLEMVIEFTPQRWFYLGLLISVITLLGCLGYLGYDWRRRKRHKKIS